jgi:Autotransporter beta-domain/CHRD domain
MSMTITTILRSSVAAAALMSASAQAGTLFLANMTGANEVPANTSTATGVGVLILNDAKTSATITGTHNLAATGATVVAGHIHRGVAGINGPVIFPFPLPASPIGPLTWAIPTADVTNLEASGLYFNIHTTTRPGGEIRAQLIRAVLAPSAANATQSALAAALDVSAGFSADLDQVLIQTNLLSSAGAKAQALSDMSARSVYVQGRHTAETMGSLGGSLLARAEDQRLDGSASVEGPAMFVTGGYDFGKRSDTAEGAGSKIKRPFIVGGYDYKFGTGSAGLAVGYADGKENLRNNSGKTEASTFSVQGFFSSDLGGVYLDGVAGYGWVDIDTSRNITSLSRTATSSHKGNAWHAALKLSTEMDMGGGMMLLPYASIDRQEADIDGYTEAGAGALGLILPGIDNASSAIEAGVTLAAPNKQDWGTLTPRLLVGVQHVVDEKGGTFSARLVGSAVSFATPLQHPGKTAARVEASISGEMSSGSTVALGYRGLVGANDQTNHGIEARLSFRF